MSRQGDVLAMLRQAILGGERPLIGYDHMAAYLAAIGWRTREGYPPSAYTLRRWAQQRGFPVALLPGRPRRAWTTTHAVSAWLLAGAGGLGATPLGLRRGGGWRGQGGRPRRVPAVAAPASRGGAPAPEGAASQRPAEGRAPAPGCRFCRDWSVMPTGRRCSVCGRAGAAGR